MIDKLSPEEIAELRQSKKALAEYVKRNFHTCSYECDRPECIKAQRDELRSMMYSNTAEIRRYHKVCQMALEALESHTAIKHPQQMHYRDSAIEALRDVLGEKNEQTA